jgi:hypothetical protein
MRPEILQCGQELFGSSSRLVSRIFDDASPDDVLKLAHRVAMRTCQIGRRPSPPWVACGGFKRLYDVGSDRVVLSVQPTCNIKVIRMVLKEVCLQLFLSRSGFVPTPSNFRVFRSGTLANPMFEMSFDMPKLTMTLHEWFHEKRTKEEVLNMLCQVVSHMSDINEMGLVHCDMKLDNIMAMVGRSASYTDKFKLCTTCTDMRWHIIDFGLCNTTANGDDIFFFCWWLFHRAKDTLDRHKITSVVRERLLVHSDFVPQHMAGRIHCYTSSGVVDFSRPTGQGASPFAKQYGIEKDTLYGLGQAMRSYNTHEDFLQKIAGAMRW